MLKRNLMANYLGQGWTGLMSLAFVPLYIKFLGIEAYGLIGLFAVLQACMAILDAGMTPTLAREMARFQGGAHTAESVRDLLRTIETVLFTIALLAATVIWACSGWLATHWLKADKLPTETVSQAIMIMGWVTASRMVEGMYRSCLVGLQRQVFFNVLNAALATIRAVGAIAILAYVSPSIHAFFMWQGAVSLGTICVLAWATYTLLPKRTGSSRFSRGALADVWRFAGGMLATTGLSLLLTQLDKVLLSNLLTLGQYGNYSLAVSVAGALYMLITPITQACYPRLCELHSRGDRAGVASVYHQGAQLVSVLAGSAAVMIGTFAGEFLQLWTQSSTLAMEVGPLLSLLIIGNLLNGLMWMPYQMQLANGWTSLAVSTNIVAVLLVVPGILWATPRFGAVGAAAVWTLLNVAYVLLGAHLMYRRILRGEKNYWYLHDLLKPLGLAVAAAACTKFAIPTPSSVLGQLAYLAMASVVTLAAAGLGAPDIRSRLAAYLRPLFSNFRHSA